MFISRTKVNKNSNTAKETIGNIECKKRVKGLQFDNNLCCDALYCKKNQEMKRYTIIMILCLAWASSFAQGVCGHPKAERMLMRMAEVEIEGFFCDSVITEYPIYTDGEKAELDAVLVKTKDGVVWCLKENDDDEITYEKNSENNVKLFKQLEAIKPDKIYLLPNEPQFFIAEKDGKKQKVKK